MVGLGDWPAGDLNQNFCIVTVTYTHPRWNDNITVWTWLPLSDWNGRFLVQGGGGFMTGDAEMFHPPGLERGFAVTSTDGGHELSNDPTSWALKQNGAVDYYRLKDFAYVALHDANSIGKAVTEAFYGQPPKYSYYSSCSSGGRQGLAMAQRYPNGYDGILALAPAINWATFVVADYWSQFVMNQLGVYSRLCELDAITAAAIETCDELDGVKDGIVSAPGLCLFDPHPLVGRTLDCAGVEAIFTEAATTIALPEFERCSRLVWSQPGYSVDGIRVYSGHKLRPANIYRLHRQSIRRHNCVDFTIYPTTT